MVEALGVCGGVQGPSGLHQFAIVDPVGVPGQIADRDAGAGQAAGDLEAFSVELDDAVVIDAAYSGNGKQRLQVGDVGQRAAGVFAAARCPGCGGAAGGIRPGTVADCSLALRDLRRAVR
jgi:hypothetical protein